MAEEWLVGVYRGKLVTAGESYKKELWTKLPELRKSDLLAYSTKRVMLAPHFFFIKPAAGAERLQDIRSTQAPQDFGLPDAAYEPIAEENPNIKVMAKGTHEGGCFTIEKTPRETSAIIPEEGICALALIDTTPNTVGTSRTGTFFMYRKEGKGIKAKPLTHRNNCLTGKGILVGAWKDDRNHWGRMIEHQYLRERLCPASIGSARFERGGTKYYIIYRSSETDMRLDMPAALLYLAKTGGYKRLANNLGRSMDHAFGKYVDRLFKRDVLADGIMVDYEDINGFSNVNYDIRKHQKQLKMLEKDVFGILLLAAAAASYQSGGLRAVLSGREERTRFLNRNIMQITGKYQALCREFLNGLSAENRCYFKGETGGNPSLENIGFYLKETVGGYLPNTTFGTTSGISEARKP